MLGPNLTNLADRATLAAGIIENNADNLVRWIRHTQDVKPGALMGLQQPDGSYKPFDMTDDEARQLAAFLLSPSAEGMPAGAAPSAEAAAAPAAGLSAEQIFLTKACIGCHKIPGIAAAVGIIGPDLAGLMSRPTIAAGRLQTNEANLRKWISNPKAVKADTLMVTPPLSEAEIDAVVEFLLKLK
jgi:cytochrome c1